MWWLPINMISLRNIHKHENNQLGVSPPIAKASPGCWYFNNAARRIHRILITSNLWTISKARYPIINLFRRISPRFQNGFINCPKHSVSALPTFGSLTPQNEIKLPIKPLWPCHRSAEYGEEKIAVAPLPSCLSALLKQSPVLRHPAGLYSVSIPRRGVTTCDDRFSLSISKMCDNN